MAQLLILTQVVLSLQLSFAVFPLVMFTADRTKMGELVAPRDQPTREVLGATIVVEDPTNVLPIGVTRNAHLPIAAAEALQLIGGVSHPELMCRIASKFPNFMDGGVFHGAYGPRVRPQLASVVRRHASRGRRSFVHLVLHPLPRGRRPRPIRTRRGLRARRGWRKHARQTAQLSTAR